jgi:hypothetical protein
MAVDLSNPLHYCNTRYPSLSRETAPTSLYVSSFLRGNMPYEITTESLLHEVHALLQKGWCQKYFAKNADGQDVHETSKQAVAWCLSGAMNAVHHKHRNHSQINQQMENVSSLVDFVLTPEYIPRLVRSDFNDDPRTTKKLVLKVIRNAIQVGRLKLAG